MPGIDLIYDITEIFQMHNIETEIIAASVRNPIHVIDCAKAVSYTHLDVYKRQAIALNGVTAPDDIVILHLVLKPLVNLILSLCALNNVQPVPAGAFGILGSEDFQLVAVLDYVLYGHQLAVHPGPHHLVAHCTMYTCLLYTSRCV